MYKALIPPCMAYGAMFWMSSAAIHLQKLDVVQQPALRLVYIDEDQLYPSPVTSLEHLRDVSTLAVCNKRQVQRVSHLDILRLPPHKVQGYTGVVTG